MCFEPEPCKCCINLCRPHRFYNRLDLQALPKPKLNSGYLPIADVHLIDRPPNDLGQRSQQPQGRKALLIGINYFGQRGQMHGRTDEAQNIYVYLTTYLGYSRESIIILTDDKHQPWSQPTKRNILVAMHWLVKDAQPDDALLFYYSGHGGPSSRPKIQSTHKLGGIYPADFRYSGDICGSEMDRILIQLLNSGIRLVVICDYHGDLTTLCGWKETFEFV